MNQGSNRDDVKRNAGDKGAGAAGAAVGATAGGLAGAGAAVGIGAAIGTVGGPVGMAVGAAIGGIVGGVAGAAVGERLNPEKEHEYWRNNYVSRPYVQKGASYNDYGPAYQYGWESQGRYTGRNFNEVESELSTNWATARGTSSLPWDRARPAIYDSWMRSTEVDLSKVK